MGSTKQVSVSISATAHESAATPDGHVPLERDPRVRVDTYVVYPTGYDDMAHSDKDLWCLSVVDGHAWGWSIRQGRGAGGPSMNRQGEWIFERRGSDANKARRWTLDEALALALEHVDTHRINGVTALEASALVAARVASAAPQP